MDYGERGRKKVLVKFLAALLIISINTNCEVSAICMNIKKGHCFSHCDSCRNAAVHMLTFPYFVFKTFYSTLNLTRA